MLSAQDRPVASNSHPPSSVYGNPCRVPEYFRDRTLRRRRIERLCDLLRCRNFRISDTANYLYPVSAAEPPPSVSGQVSDDTCSRRAPVCPLPCCLDFSPDIRARRQRQRRRYIIARLIVGTSFNQSGISGVVILDHCRRQRRRNQKT